MSVKQVQKIAYALAAQNDLSCEAGTEHKESRRMSAANIARFDGWDCESISEEIPYPPVKWCNGCLIRQLGKISRKLV